MPQTFNSLASTVRLSLARPLVRALFWAGAGAVAVAFGGCTEAPYGTGSQSFKLPWPDASGNYSEQTVVIDTLDHPESLSGQWAQILVRPGAVRNELSGPAPVGRFVRDGDGVLWPADSITREATVIYAHFERLQAMNAALGAAELGIWSALWPAKIGIRSPSVSGSPVDQENNAFYDCGYRAILSVPYDVALPVTMNAGVLAHEQFHASFCAVVLNALAQQNGQMPTMAFSDDYGAGVAPTAGRGSKKPSAFELTLLTPSAFNDFVLRGINEGFADYMGWVYTGDPQFLSKSLAAVGQPRRLDVSPAPMLTADDWTVELNRIMFMSDATPQLNARRAVNKAYALGTQQAILLRQMTIDMAGGDSAGALSKEARMRGGKAVIQALPLIAAEAKAAYAANRKIDPRMGARAFVRSLPAGSSGACPLYDRLIASPAGSEEKPHACALLKEDSK